MAKTKKRSLEDLQEEENIKALPEDLKSETHLNQTNDDDDCSVDCEDESEYENDSDIESDEEDEFDEDEEEDEEVDEIQVEFEAFSPENKDWHGIRSLLKQLLLRSEVNVGDLSDLVIGESNDTSIVMKQIEDDDEEEEEDEEDNLLIKKNKKSSSKSKTSKDSSTASQSTEEDQNQPKASSSSSNTNLNEAEDAQNLEVFSITSLLNLNDSQVRARSSITQVVDLLHKIANENKSKNASGAATMLKVLDQENGNRIGLCLNERFINLPYRVGFESLQHVLAESERKNIKFTHFIMFSKLLRPKNAPKKKKSIKTNDNRSKKAKLVDESDENCIRLNPEDELFAELADAVLEYKADNEYVDCTVNVNWESGTDFLPFRQVLLLNSRSFKNALKRLKQNLNDLSEVA